ncbi:uncharacterized protein [Venturia canescens]|uniref:uncharacterized protein n=1 Tax=Venturia canescens TaxID=32260 RepID=UPI001C9CD348|nr:uncharacterized protein LOC122414926 [Venturia canescens]
MASKAPKSRCYSLSASADYRFACSVGQKNLGETYTQEIVKKMELSPGTHHLQHVARTDKLLLRRRSITSMRDYKKKRIQNKQARSALQHLRENHEGVTYDSNCGLLTQFAVPDEEKNQNIEVDDGVHSFILFDLETSSLRRDCDILQIAAMCGSEEFNIYANPRQQISPYATAVTGLINSNGMLLLHGKIVSSVPIKTALENFLAWIEGLGKKAILLTHNLIFDGPRLYDSIKKYHLEEKFSNVIHGFLDTLPLIRCLKCKKRKGECTLGGLAKSLNVVVVEAHNAIFDCKMLSKILAALKITETTLVENMKTYRQKIDEWNSRDKDKVTLIGLKPMETILSLATLKKLAAATITLQDLQSIYSTLGAEGIQNFFNEKMSSATMAKIQKKTIERIIQFITTSCEKSIPKELEREF